MTGTARTGAWGFVGLGEMGEPMVANLLAQGLEVVAFDCDQERVGLSAARGAGAAGGVAEVARAADIVSICVREAAQLHAVLDDGLVGAASPSTVVLIHSTVGREACRAAAARLAARGACVLDAPVSGMRMAAEAGTLAFFVSGPVAALDGVRHGLDAMGRVVMQVGDDVGAGQVVKIANNLMAFASAGLVHEVTEFARRADVDEERLLEALSHGSARSWVIENWPFLSREWSASQPGGAAAVRAIVQKDLDLAATTAQEVGVEAPFTALAAGTVPAVLGRGAEQRS